MLKVVAVSDKVGTALDRLCKMVIPMHDNIDYTVCDVHPKRPSTEQLQTFEVAARTADIIDFQYFRSALKLIELYPWLLDKKLVLTHNNPYSIYEQSWEQFTLVANNKSIQKDLARHTGRKVAHIPLATDPYFWQFKRDWEPNKRVMMVANRIESSKGILEGAIACGDLGLTFVLVGAVSDREYLHSIFQTGAVEFHEQVTDEALRDLYYGAGIVVCNSKDNFESGTLPILEAMQCGVPVLTRMVGHVPDIYNKQNLTLLDGQPEDVSGITRQLENMINDKKAMEVQRQAAWNTAKNFNPTRRAYAYQMLYRSLLPGEPVSIIVPVYDKPEVIRTCLNAIAKQDYPNIEIIVCDDNSRGASNRGLVKDFAETVNFPVRYIPTDQSDYGLARARNMGIIEATGDILVFCDQRMIMAPNAVSEFVANLTPQTWLFGNKGGNKETFVENFSCISRHEIIEAGLFNERINKYGGMSQEIRARTRARLQHRYLPSAKATPTGKSHNRNSKKMEIVEMKDLLWKLGL